MSSHAASISAWCAVLDWPSIVAAFTMARWRVARRSAALRNTAARRSNDHADHSRHASRAAAIAPSISFGPAWCTLASTWRWQCGITASTVLPVQTSRPPTTTGISRTRADRSFRVRFSSTRSGVPGAYERTGSLTGVGILTMTGIYTGEKDGDMQRLGDGNSQLFYR